nr:ribose-phosphate pyrophosphokinase-like domain-containing protein [Candidatus Woesebacteria bacterium]
MYIIAGSSNPPLAKKIANKLGTTTKSKKFQLIPIEISKFANDEKRIWINDNQLLKNQEVCLIQSFNAPVDEHIIETLLIIDALERLGAKSVTLI